MRMTFVVAFLLFAAAGLSNAFAQGEPCDKTFLTQLDGDKTLTSIQRQKKADDQCVGKLITANGSVNDVSSNNNIELITADGLRFDVYLSPAHKCGDLVGIQKGQRISVQGRIFKVFIGRREYVVREAVCVR